MLLYKSKQNNTERKTMHYLLAIILPPVAVLTAGFRPVSFILNILLCCLGFIPGIIHAILVVNERKADKRTKRQTRALVRAQAQ
jgi:uncharacterized membrane protein YqaE (UPF0057 family)